LDRVDYVLCPESGLFGIADFYTAGKQESLLDKSIGGLGKECGWFTRWFWQIFFEFDHVGHSLSLELVLQLSSQLYLGSAQRTYLEYRFGTVGFISAGCCINLERGYSDQELQRAKQFCCSLYCSNVKGRFGMSRPPLTKTLSPYFVWLGRSRFPNNFPLDRSLEVEYVLNENPGIKIDDVPLTPFHYSITKVKP
jgi:hypothetical protein